MKGPSLADRRTCAEIKESHLVEVMHMCHKGCGTKILLAKDLLARINEGQRQHL